MSAEQSVFLHGLAGLLIGIVFAWCILSSL